MDVSWKISSPRQMSLISLLCVSKLVGNICYAINCTVLMMKKKEWHGLASSFWSMICMRNWGRLLGVCFSFQSSRPWSSSHWSSPWSMVRPWSSSHWSSPWSMVLLKQQLIKCMVRQ